MKRSVLAAWAAALVTAILVAGSAPALAASPASPDPEAHEAGGHQTPAVATLESAPSDDPSQAEIHADPALEALLLDEYEGSALIRMSFRGASGQPDSYDTILLDRLGKVPDDMTQAVTLDPTGTIDQLHAISVRGTPGEAILPAWIDAFGSGNLGSSATYRWADVDGAAVMLADGEWLYGDLFMAMIPTATAIVLIRASDEEGRADLVARTLAHLEDIGIPPSSPAVE